MGAGALHGLLRLGEELLPTWNEITLDARVLAATACAGLLTSLLFGAAPAFHFSRIDLRSTLVECGSRGYAGGRRHWSQRVFVFSQVALGVLLLVSAGLLMRTFSHLHGLQPGFDAERVFTASVSLQDARYAETAPILRLYEEGLARLRRQPGVEEAAVTLGLPYERVLNMGFHRVDGPHVHERQNEITNLCYVTPALFDVLRIPLRAGRRLSDADGANAAPALVVNEAFVDTYLRGQEAVGSHLRIGRNQIFTVVGVVGNVQQRPGWGNNGPLAAMPLAYVTVAQMPEKVLLMVHTWFSPNWVVRLRPGAPTGTLGALRQALAGVDPLLPVAAPRPIVQARSDALRSQRFLMVLLAALAALALLLSSVGLYGLIATSVTERTRELGVRLALGAPRAGLLRLVLAPVVVLVAGGLCAGALLAVAAGRLLRSLLWGVTALDGWTYAGVAVVFLIVAAAAAALPALRVARLDPALTLRQD